ncbi:hypothetical protein B0H66DRAFT_551670 [Apodospora peruviana]|uniref:Microbial-type PARG catalytic domain-containing protein n=1 Tax=Apodospora peruviana TaxID=516989 RepID=A0AAE0MBW9_9PEZI|nr:hypothetical protein B0H66DRAFT_551670 [Apodospora peruviana]
MKLLDVIFSRNEKTHTAVRKRRHCTAGTIHAYQRQQQDGPLSDQHSHAYYPPSHQANLRRSPRPSSSRSRRSPTAHTSPRPSSSRSRHSPPPEYTTDPSTRDTLRDTARQTQTILPPVLARLGRTSDAQQSLKHNLSNPFRLDPATCPCLPHGARIRVVNDDTLNAAISLAHHKEDPFLPPAIVNFADRERPGGGWLNGAVAQEEALCYRTSLSLSLETSRRTGHYPLAVYEAEVLYAPYVVVVRGDLANGHRLLTDNLPAVSVLTVPAIRRPHLRRVGTLGHSHKYVFQRDGDRNLTKDKMRLVLRTAATYRHRNLVLGALGCGVYANPPEDVAACWLEVLRENEFEGNWWRSVVFAVYDPKNEVNFDVFSRVLDGKLV